MKAITQIIFAASLCLITAIAAADNGSLPVSNPTRAFGYTVGDLLEQAIGLNDGETTHTLQALPDIQREGRWITRQSAELNPTGQWLIIRYQIINSPPDVRLVSLPALTLSTTMGSSIEVPEWSFSVAPLTPLVPVAENSLPVMQNDWSPEAPSSIQLVRKMKGWSAALIALLFLWFAWWVARGMREASTLPFAHAYRAIRKHKTNTPNEDEKNWLSLHRAFDQASGRSINSGTIPALLQSTEWLEPFESDIRAFYKLSSERFFANDKPQTLFELAGFSKRLYKAEKRHTSKLPKHSLTTQEMS
ncbi:MAG: hypothetical protein AB8B87_22145 [Granulosicoccus sp.]